MKRLVLVSLVLCALTSGASAQVVEHPAGCPRVLFCACGASVKLFGHAVPNLFAARSWYRFPRSAPAPRMVAVRPHHVFVLLEHVAGSSWLVYDANSGGHATRVHVRSIAAYTIVNAAGAA
jgi:hypothetical protein